MQKLLEKYNDYLTETLKANTAASYMQDLMKFVNERGLKTVSDIAKITSEDVNEYIIVIKNRGTAYSTLSRNVSSLKRFFSYCKNGGIITTNIIIDAQIPQRQRKLPDTITFDEVVRILEAPDITTVKGMRDKAMLELMYATGARVSEIINLKVNDVGLKNEVVVISYSGKTRFVPLGRTAVQSVLLYLKDGRSKIPMSEKSDVLFLNFYGTPLTRQGFWKIIKCYIEAAGVSGNVTAQTLRHSFALHLLSNGADVHSVSEMMGYSDVASTKIYLDVMNNKIKNVYKKAHPRA